MEPRARLSVVKSRPSGNPAVTNNPQADPEGRGRRRPRIAESGAAGPSENGACGARNAGAPNVVHLPSQTPAATARPEPCGLCGAYGHTADAPHCALCASTAHLTIEHADRD